MKKKGQFFLIATFIVITLFLSLTLMYNYSKPLSRGNNLDSLANNLKYEGIQIINNGFNKSLDHNSINQNLINFTNITSNSFKPYTFVIIIVDPSRNALSYKFEKGVMADLDFDLAPSAQNISLNLNTQEFSFNIMKGYNFFVIILYEEQGERYVYTA